MKRMNTINLPHLFRIKETENNLNNMTRFRKFFKENFLQSDSRWNGIPGEVEKSPYLDVFKNSINVFLTCEIL